MIPSSEQKLRYHHQNNLKVLLHWPNSICPGHEQGCFTCTKIKNRQNWSTCLFVTAQWGSSSVCNIEMSGLFYLFWMSGTMCRPECAARGMSECVCMHISVRRTEKRKNTVMDHNGCLAERTPPHRQTFFCSLSILKGQVCLTTLRRLLLALLLRCRG